MNAKIIVTDPCRVPYRQIYEPLRVWKPECNCDVVDMLGSEIFLPPWPDKFIAPVFVMQAVVGTEVVLTLVAGCN